MKRAKFIVIAALFINAQSVMTSDDDWDFGPPPRRYDLNGNIQVQSWPSEKQIENCQECCKSSCCLLACLIGSGCCYALYQQTPESFKEGRNQYKADTSKMD